MTENLTETPPQATGTPKELKDMPVPPVADLPAEPVPDAFSAALNTNAVEPPVTAPAKTDVLLADKPAEVSVPSPESSSVPNEDATKLMEGLLETKNPEPIVKAAPPPHENKPLPKSGPKKGLLLAVLAILLVALPVGVYFISKQNEALTEQRSKAAGVTPYGPSYKCSFNNPNSCPAGQECHCTGGTNCTGSECVTSEWIKNVCTSQGRAWCDNEHGFAKTCCVKGYKCCSTMDGCCKDDTPPPGDDDDDTGPSPTPTPTSVTPVCQNIKIYKGGQQVTPNTLRAGDAVVLAVKGNLAPTKAHFRVNGGNWQETATKNNNNEWTLNYTIPSGVKDFVIEGEVFTNGAWR